VSQWFWFREANNAIRWLHSRLLYYLDGLADNEEVEKSRQGWWWRRRTFEEGYFQVSLLWATRLAKPGGLDNKPIRATQLPREDG
jgi:hypothetical protein